MTTPVRKQYLHIKRQYPDTILFFRLGDFYETFDEDARTVARELDIVLTSRPIGKNERVPLAGVPYHAVDGYIAKLIGSGHKVAICEQMGDEPVKGLVPREVVRVVTPGTVVEPSILDERENNYLASLVIGQNGAGLAHVDISTGEFEATELTEGMEFQRLVVEELARLRPSECLMPVPDVAQTPGWLVDAELPMAMSEYESWHFELDNARRALLDHFEVASLDGFGCEMMPLAVQAAGALVQYLQETQRGALRQLTMLSTYAVSEFMTLDAATRRNLELTHTIRSGTERGSLLKVLDKTSTAMGARMFRRWLNQPLLNVSQLNGRLDAVRSLHDDSQARSELIDQLTKVADLERLTNRVVQGIGIPRDLVGIRQSLEVVPRVRDLLAGMELGGDHVLGDAHGNLDPCSETFDLISMSIVDEPPTALNKTGVVRPGFAAELDHIAATARDAKEWVLDLERDERSRTGIKNLKVGYNKVFGYYLEITKSNAHSVPREYIRKQTLVNAERYITPELKEYESVILNAQEQLLEVESRILREVCEQVASFSSRLLSTARALADLDVYASLAEVALSNRYVRPVLDDVDSV